MSAFDTSRSCPVPFEENGCRSEHILNKNCSCIKSLDRVAYRVIWNLNESMFTLLFADDTVLFAETKQGLQTALNGLKLYCKRKKMVINTTKTKELVFSRGKIRNKPVLYLNGESLETVDDYVYLGIIFNYNDTFKKACYWLLSQDTPYVDTELYLLVQPTTHAKKFPLVTVHITHDTWHDDNTSSHNTWGMAWHMTRDT